jgi:diketogulonate reductase-like aldo/keto reductase
VELGLADAVGVSNFNAARVRGAARALEARGTCLASNQVSSAAALSCQLEQKTVTRPTNHSPATT